MIDRTKILLSFDPGISCGWAKWDHLAYTAGTVDGEDAIDVLVRATRTLRLGAVVIEDFIGGGQMWSEMRYTLLLVGRLRGACQALGITPAVQTPQVKDPFLGDAERLLGKRHTKHASDDVSALSHLLAFQYRQTH